MNSFTQNFKTTTTLEDGINFINSQNISDADKAKAIDTLTNRQAVKLSNGVTIVIDENGLLDEN